jgi:hypothetical protein
MNFEFLKKKSVYVAISLSIAVYIFHAMFFSVNLIFEDIWEEIPAVIKFHNGTLSLLDFFTYQNEHRIFVHYLFSTIMNILSGYNIKVLVFSSAVITILCFFIIYKIMRKDFTHVKALIPFILLPFLCLSLKPQQIVFLPDLPRVFLLFFALLSFYFIQRRSYIAPFLAALGAFSLVSGLLIWFAGMLQIMLMMYYFGQRRKWTWYLITWISAGILCWVLYFIVLPGKMPGSHVNIYIFEHPIKTIHFLMSYIGAALFYGMTMSAVAGMFISILILILFLYFIRNRELVKSPYVIFWIAFLFWSLLQMVLVAFGRMSYSLTWAVSERYVYGSLDILISVMVLMLYLLDKFQSGFLVTMNRILYGICVCGIILYFIHAPAGAFHNKEMKLKYVEVLKNFEKEDKASLEKIYPSEAVVRNYAPFLKEHHYNVFK